MNSISVFTKSLILVFLLVSATALRAQINKVTIGVNGLTCSQCNRNVEMSLRKLPFVNEVNMSLEKTEGVITFYINQDIDIEKIAQSVIKAGFSLRFLKADIDFNKIKLSDDMCFDAYGARYQIINNQKAQLTGVKTVQFLGNKYQTKTDLKKWQPLMHTNSNQTYYYVTVI